MNDQTLEVTLFPRKNCDDPLLIGKHCNSTLINGSIQFVTMFQRLASISGLNPMDPNDAHSICHDDRLAVNRFAMFLRVTGRSVNLRELKLSIMPPLYGHADQSIGPAQVTKV